MNKALENAAKSVKTSSGYFALLITIAFVSIVAIFYKTQLGTLEIRGLLLFIMIFLLVFLYTLNNWFKSNIIKPGDFKDDKNFIEYLKLMNSKDNILQNNPLSEKDSKLYLLNLLDPGDFGAFNVIYYKSIGDKIKIEMNHNENVIKYYKNMELIGESRLDNFLNSLFKFKDKNIIRVNSVDPLSFEINDAYKKAIIELHNEY